MDGSILLDSHEKINSDPVPISFVLAFSAVIPYNTSWTFIEITTLELIFHGIQKIYTV